MEVFQQVKFTDLQHLTYSLDIHILCINGEGSTMFLLYAHLQSYKYYIYIHTCTYMYRLTPSL